MRSVMRVAATAGGPAYCIGALQTKGDVRRALFPALVAGNARWLDASGLTATAPRSHARMLRTVTELRRSDLLRPHTGVIDWSTVQDCPADGLALFPLLAIALQQEGTRVICCRPVNPSLSAALEELAEPAVGEPQWVASSENAWDVQLSARSGMDGRKWKTRIDRQIRASNSRLVLPESCAFDPNDRAGRTRAGKLCDAFADAAANVGIEVGVAERANSVAREAVANLRHSRARNASVVAVTDIRRRSVEFAVADDGVGIARTMSEKLPDVGLTTMPDRYWVGEALVGLAPGSEIELERRVGARGFTRTLRGLLEVSNATAVVRSGGVAFTVNGWGSHPIVVGSTSRGFGSQTFLRLAA